MTLEEFVGSLWTMDVRVLAGVLLFWAACFVGGYLLVLAVIWRWTR